MMGVLYGLLGLLFLPSLLWQRRWSVRSARSKHFWSPPSTLTGMMFGFGLLIPVIYGVMGFVGGIIMAALTTSSRVGLAVLKSKLNRDAEIRTVSMLI